MSGECDKCGLVESECYCYAEEPTGLLCFGWLPEDFWEKPIEEKIVDHKDEDVR